MAGRKAGEKARYYIINLMGARILIVDDSGFARRLLRRILEGGGFKVEEAADGNQALEKYAASKPDVVFLDVIMEGMEGLEVLNNLRKMDGEAKVVMATADTQKATRDEALKAGASAFVKKPFDPEEVLQVVPKVMEA